MEREKWASGYFSVDARGLVADDVSDSIETEACSGLGFWSRRREDLTTTITTTTLAVNEKSLLAFLLLLPRPPQSTSPKYRTKMANTPNRQLLAVSSRGG